MNRIYCKKGSVNQSLISFFLMIIASFSIFMEPVYADNNGVPDIFKDSILTIFPSKWKESDPIVPAINLKLSGNGTIRCLATDARSCSSQCPTTVKKQPLSLQATFQPIPVAPKDYGPKGTAEIVLPNGSSINFNGIISALPSVSASVSITFLGETKQLEVQSTALSLKSDKGYSGYVGIKSDNIQGTLNSTYFKKKARLKVSGMVRYTYAEGCQWVGTLKGNGT